MAKTADDAHWTGSLSAPIPIAARTAFLVSLSIPLRRLNCRGSRTTSRVLRASSMPAGCKHVERGPREVRGDEQLALERPGGGQPLGGSGQLLVPIGVTDTGTGCSDEHVEGLTGRHEQAGCLTALAGEVLDARQSAPIDVEELADDRVGLCERKQDVRYEHRGLELGLGCSLAAASARTDDRAQEQARRGPFGGARVHLAYLCVGALPVEHASGAGMVVAATMSALAICR